jgi:hypothetical protein
VHRNRVRVVAVVAAATLINPADSSTGGWTLVAIGLNLAVCPPATSRPRV